MVERVRVVVHRDKNSVPPAYFDEYSEGDYCDEEDSEEDNEISAEDYYIDAIDKAETLLALIRDRVSKLPSVQRLELPWFDSSSDILSSITPLTRLSSLHLISEDATQAVSLDALCDAPAGQRGLRHLRVTTFRDVHVSPSGIAAIATLQNLESLSLGPERNPALRCCGRLPRGHLEEIAKLQGLTSLELLYGR